MHKCHTLLPHPHPRSKLSCNFSNAQCTTFLIHISQSTDLPAPVVGSVEDSTVTAGNAHTLQCTVTEIPHLAVQPTVELIGPGGSLVTMDVMVTHTVDPVRTSDAGQYTCRASVVIPSASVDISGQSSSTLTVHSKLKCLLD